MNVLLITQARMGSTRLPGKVLKNIAGKSLLQIHLERLSRCEMVDKILVATTNGAEDVAIKDHVQKFALDVYRGSENDVLDRFYQAAIPFKPKWIVRVTADCPLIDWTVVDEVVRLAIKLNVDYCTNTLLETFPDGQDVEVFKFTSLEKAWLEAVLPSEREHVTPFIRKNSSFLSNQMFSSANSAADENFSHVRMTVDTPEDFEVITKLIEALGFSESWKQYAIHAISYNLSSINSAITRNEGYLKSLEKDKNEYE
jgi:spore coat polysaccharide biosynthesis protein SpsF